MGIEKKIGAVFLGLALMVGAIIVLRTLNAPAWAIIAAVAVCLALLVVFMIPAKNKADTAKDSADDKKDDKAPAASSSSSSSSKPSKAIDWFWAKAAVLIIGIGLGVYYLAWPFATGVWNKAFGSTSTAATATAHFKYRKPKRVNVPVLHDTVIESGVTYRFLPKEGPIHAEFYKFRRPIMFRWRQEDGTGGWTTLKPKDDGKTTFWAYKPDGTGPHQIGLPLEVRIAKCPKRKRHCTTHLKLVNNAM